MKGIEGVPLQYILTIVVAVAVIGVVVGFMTSLTGAVEGLGKGTVVTMNKTALDHLCKTGLDQGHCCKSCSNLDPNKYPSSNCTEDC